MKQASMRTLLAAMFIAAASAQLTFSEQRSATDGGAVTTPIAEGDARLTVAETVTFATLDCPTLATLADAESLTIPVSAAETITANRTSFETLDGSSFDDGIARSAWLGERLTQEEDEIAPTTVSMVWSDPCEIETFSLKITSFKTDGTTVVIRSIPCSEEGGIDTCLVTVTTEFQDGDGLIAFTTGAARRKLRSETRKLQEEPITLAAMFLYTDGARAQLGDVSPLHMASAIMGSVFSTNAAFENSEIPLLVLPSYIGVAPITENPDDAVESVISLQGNEDVRALRDTYEADLVQLVAGFTGCGAAYPYNGEADNGFSAVSPSCFEGLWQSWMFAVNLGCFESDGYRSCDSAAPFSTIMGLYCPDLGSSGRINHFANPNVLFEGEPTGTATQNCAQIIIDNMATVETYQPIVDDEFYTSEGCFADSVANRVLPGASFTDSAMTTDDCASFCTGYAYFGTEFGVECFCGWELPSTTSDSCTFECGGAPEEICGGSNAISVYSFNTDLNVLGCVADTFADRIFEPVLFDDSMTTELCAEECTGFTYYGTQFGRECWCGDDEDYARHGSSGNCVMTCAGDSNQICGGPLAMNVYEY